jgi:hypothetical protein
LLLPLCLSVLISIHPSLPIHVPLFISFQCGGLSTPIGSSSSS